MSTKISRGQRAHLLDVAHQNSHGQFMRRICRKARMRIVHQGGEAGRISGSTWHRLQADGSYEVTP